MAVRRLAEKQPESFAFSPEGLEWAKGQIAKYPEGRQASAVIALLWRAQDEGGGWVSEPAIRVVADMLGMAYIRVLEVATFYTMFNLEPVGRHLVQVCGTTPCMLRGANALKEVCRRIVGPERHVSEDGAFSWMEVECLGACANAPMVQINVDYFEDLTAESLANLLVDLRAGKPVTPGSQTGRHASAPAGELTSLTDPTLYDGSVIGTWRQRFQPKEDAAPVAAPAPADAAKGPSQKSDAAETQAQKTDTGAGGTGLKAVPEGEAGKPRQPTGNAEKPID
ncbi:MAG TPA: NADH-quinone oxidoreductase subunit NuoE [Hyphomicrobiales bacterium]|nr:NADH-quinone oxidoreductase subunit NuoE [Hyphomicrobiales bacterium]